MMHRDVRAIRATLTTIREADMSHTRRDQKLRVVRDLIRNVWDRYRDVGSDDVLMLVDHLRAAWALCHAQRPTGDHQTLETHTEVKQRLWLADEVLAFLITKLEQDNQAPHLWHPLEGFTTTDTSSGTVTWTVTPEATGNRDVDEIPF